MALSDGLRKLREDYLAGRHRFAGWWDWLEAMVRAFPDNAEAEEAWRILDDCTPHPLKHSFRMFAEGSEWREKDGRLWSEYVGEPRPAQVAAVIGRAIVAVLAREAA